MTTSGRIVVATNLLLFYFCLWLNVDELNKDKHCVLRYIDWESINNTIFVIMRKFHDFGKIKFRSTKPKLYPLIGYFTETGQNN